MHRSIDMSKKWQRDRKKDYFYKKAKAEEYRSRASFKLKQLNKKFRLIRRGDCVLDLGAAPGGWMQVAGEIVREKGIVVGVDLAEIEPFTEENIVSIKGDMTLQETINAAKEYSGEFDVVISDASPDISGAWDLDHFNSVDLARHGLNISKQLLKEGGNFLVKVFQGSMTQDFFPEVKRNFEFAKLAKPDASRKQSAEVYIVGKGLLKTPVMRGDIVELEIVDVGERGDGVGYIEEFKIIVEGGRPNETVQVKIKKVSRSLAWGVKV
jgi:23S rRNA (uridine2552-2'-O)-methyltransferase